MKLVILMSVMTKKALRDMIGRVSKDTVDITNSRFLDEIKELGIHMAFKVVYRSTLMILLYRKKK